MHSLDCLSVPDASDAVPTALLLMDFQRFIVDRFPSASAVERAGAALAAARAAGVPVVFVRVARRSGPTEDSPETQVVPELAPRPGEPVVVKRRISAFAGSDLDVVLRDLGVRRLVLAGISTSGVVLSTLRQALDLDFALEVLADACADSDPEVHRVLTEKVLARHAAVRTVAEWAASAG
jgi:nicotinamidase-related amidase